MFDLVLAQGDVRTLLAQAARRTLVAGGVRMCRLTVGRQQLTIADAGGAHVALPAFWPDVVLDWEEVHRIPPYPGEASPALAQGLSELGVSAFAVAYDAARNLAGTAWYEHGMLVLVEQVTSSPMAWSRKTGLGQPTMDGLAGAATSLAHALGGNATVLDRIEAQHAAGARAVVERALARLCDHPPAADDLAGMVATAPTENIAL